MLENKKIVAVAYYLLASNVVKSSERNKLDCTMTMLQDIRKDDNGGFLFGWDKINVTISDSPNLTLCNFVYFVTIKKKLRKIHFSMPMLCISPVSKAINIRFYMGSYYPLFRNLQTRPI